MGEPWIEKYRPRKVGDIVLNDTNKTIINNMITSDCYPNLLLYGPPGTGKTTTILCLMNEYCSKHNCANNYIHLNASHERGIDVIRNQIMNFAEKKNLFNDSQKFVLLDEVDSMTKQAQNNLQIVIKRASGKVTFILICNFMNRIIESLRHSFMTLRFNSTASICDKFLQNCIKQEGLSIPKNKLQLIKDKYSHDLRSIINCIQNYDSSDVFLDEHTFADLLDPHKNKNLLQRLYLRLDIDTIFCFFFNKLYDKYDIGCDIAYEMKLLLTVNKNPEYFINEFIPHISKKLNLL
jgi:DNA polymerase III delta prime subunit